MNVILTNNKSNILRNALFFTFAKHNYPLEYKLIHKKKWYNVPVFANIVTWIVVPRDFFFFLLPHFRSLIFFFILAYSDSLGKKIHYYKVNILVSYLSWYPRGWLKTTWSKMINGWVQNQWPSQLWAPISRVKKIFPEI